MTPVHNSSNVKGFIYHGPEQILTVHYVGGGIYNYEKVTPAMAKEFAKAPSKGKWLQDKLVGNKAHPCKKQKK